MTSRAPFQGSRNTVRSEIFIQNCCHREQILSKKQKTKNGSLRTMTTLENRRPNRLFCTHDWDNFSISKILYIIIIRRRETGQPWKRWLQSSQKLSLADICRYCTKLSCFILSSVNLENVHATKQQQTLSDNNTDDDDDDDDDDDNNNI